MTGVGRHTGERPQHAVRAYLAAPDRWCCRSSSSLTLVAWGVLVFAAIEFGRDARSGDSTAWTFLGLAAAGATACLFVTLILGSKLVGLVRARTARLPRLGCPVDGARPAEGWRITSARRTGSVGRRT